MLRVRLMLGAVYLIGVIGVMLYLNVALTLELMVVILCVAALISGRGLFFLRDWGAFGVCSLPGRSPHRSPTNSLSPGISLN